MDTNIKKLAEEIVQKYNPENLAPFPFENIEKQEDDLVIGGLELEDDIYGIIIFKEERNTFYIAVNK